MDQQVSASDICGRCNETIINGEAVASHRGEWYHLRCLDQKRSGVILCGICKTGITILAELALTPSGAIHLRCRDPQPTADGVDGQKNGSP